MKTSFFNFLFFLLEFVEAFFDREMIRNKGESQTSQNMEHKCPICSQTYEKLVSLEAHILNHSDQISCPKCDLKMQLTSLKRHLKNIHKSQVLPNEYYEKMSEMSLYFKKIISVPVTEKVPSSPLVTELVLRKSDRNAGRKSSVGNLSETAAEQNEMFNCNSCSQKFELEEMLMRHRCSSDVENSKPDRKRRLSEEEEGADNTGGTVPCQFCSSTFTTKYIGPHIRTAHPEQCPFECSSCERRFTTIENHRRHMGHSPSCTNATAIERIKTISPKPDEDDGDDKTSCKFCSKRLLKKSLTAHMQTFHAHQLPLQCSHCESRFNHEFGFRIHLGRMKECSNANAELTIAPNLITSSASASSLSGKSKLRRNTIANCVHPSKSEASDRSISVAASVLDINDDEAFEKQVVAPSIPCPNCDKLFRTLPGVKYHCLTQCKPAKQVNKSSNGGSSLLGGVSFKYYCSQLLNCNFFVLRFQFCFKRKKGDKSEKRFMMTTFTCEFCFAECDSMVTLAKHRSLEHFKGKEDEQFLFDVYFVQMSADENSEFTKEQLKHCGLDAWSTY